MLNDKYVVGLVDGEGSFTVYVRNITATTNSFRKRRVRIEPKFYVKLVETDKQILYEMKEFFGCGNVYFQKDSRKNHKNCYRYEVSNRNDLIKIIIPFFKRNLLMFPSKTKDFKIFCQIMEGIKRGKHLNDKGLMSLYRMKQKMH